MGGRLLALVLVLGATSSARAAEPSVEPMPSIRPAPPVVVAPEQDDVEAKRRRVGWVALAAAAVVAMLIFGTNTQP